MLWCAGLGAHRVVIHSHCGSSLVPSVFNLLCAALLWYTHKAIESCLTVWLSCNHLKCQIQKDTNPERHVLPFDFSSPFSAQLKLLFARSVVSLKPHNYPSYLHSFPPANPLSTHAQPGFYVFCSCSAFIKMQSYSSLLLPSPLLLSTPPLHT